MDKMVLARDFSDGFSATIIFSIPILFNTAAEVFPIAIINCISFLDK